MLITWLLEYTVQSGQVDLTQLVSSISTGRCYVIFAKQISGIGILKTGLSPNDLLCAINLHEQHTLYNKPTSATYFVQ